MSLATRDKIKSGVQLHASSKVGELLMENNISTALVFCKYNRKWLAHSYHLPLLSLHRPLHVPATSCLQASLPVLFIQLDNAQLRGWPTPYFIHILSLWTLLQISLLSGIHLSLRVTLCITITCEIYVSAALLLSLEEQTVPL